MATSVGFHSYTQQVVVVVVAAAAAVTIHFIHCWVFHWVADDKNHHQPPVDCREPPLPVDYHRAVVMVVVVVVSSIER